MENQEQKKRAEREPEIKIVDGKDVAQYLTPELKERFIRILVTANSEGVFDERYFQRYLKLFERRVKDGQITLLLADGEPAALGGINLVGKYPDGRDLYEMGNLVVLPEFEKRGFASRLMEYRFNKICTNWPNDPIVTTTNKDIIAKKCLRLGMKEQPMEVEVRVRYPKERFLADHLVPEEVSGQAQNVFSEFYVESSTHPQKPTLDEEYEDEIKKRADNMRNDGYRNYFFDPLEEEN